MVYAGSYICVAENAVGVTTSKSVRIEVLRERRGLSCYIEDNAVLLQMLLCVKLLNSFSEWVLETKLKFPVRFLQTLRI